MADCLALASCGGALWEGVVEVENRHWQRGSEFCEDAS